MVRSSDFARFCPIFVAAVLTVPVIARAGPGTAEIELDAPLIGPAARTQSGAVAAFDGTNYLLVWHDERRFDGIWGARVTPDGTVLDTVGFPIARGGVPSVAFDGTHFVVVYAASETTPTPNGSDVWAVRVDRDGHVVDPGAYPIVRTAGDQSSPVVASNGKTTTLVVWYDNRDPETAADIWGLRLDDCGEPLDAEGGFPIAVLDDDQALPSVAYSPGPDEFLAIWKDLRGSGVNATFGARVTADGTVLDADGGIPIVADASHDGVVTGGPDGFLVAYHDFSDDTAVQAVARRVSGGGVVLDPEGIPLTAAPDEVDTLPLSAGATDDGTYVVAYHDPMSVLRARRIDSSGAVLDSTPLTPFEQPSVYRAAIAGSADAFFLAGSVQTAGPYWDSDVFLRRWTSSGDALDDEPIPVTQSANLSSEVASAFDGTNHLVVWTDHRPSGDSGVRAARLAPDGTLLDSPPLILSEGSLDPRYCDVAYDGAGTYLVAWREGEAAQEIRHARVSTDGVVSDAGGAVLGTVPTDDRSDGIRVQSAGGNFLVAWSVVTLDTTFLYAAAVSPNGTSLGGATQLAPDLVSMELASDGSQYLLVYTEYVEGYQLSALRLDEQGAAVGSKIVLAPSDPEIRVVAGATYGDGVFLTSIRQDPSDASAGQALRSYRVSPEGTSLDANGTTLVDGVRDIAGGAIAFDGTRFVVAWKTGTLDPIGWELRAKGVSPDGTPETGDVRIGHSISSTFTVPWVVRLTPGNDGSLLLTYGSVREDDDTGAERARARFIGAPFEEFVVATRDYAAASCGSGGASAGGGDGPGGSPANGSGASSGTTENGGLGGTDDIDGAGESAKDDSGCGCRVGSSAAPTHLAALLALLAAAFGRRPKRRR